MGMPKSNLNHNINDPASACIGPYHVNLTPLREHVDHARKVWAATVVRMAEATPAMAFQSYSRLLYNAPTRWSVQSI